MRHKLLCVGLSLAISSVAAAQEFDYKEIIIDISVKNGQIVKGEKGMLEFKFSIPIGYTLTSTDELPEILLLNEVPGLVLGKLEKPEPDYTDVVGGHYELEMICKMPFYFTHDTEPGEYELEFGFVIQACEKDGMCFFPTEAKDVQVKKKINLVEKQPSNPDSD